MYFTSESFHKTTLELTVLSAHYEYQLGPGVLSACYSGGGTGACLRSDLSYLNLKAAIFNEERNSKPDDSKVVSGLTIFKSLQIHPCRPRTGRPAHGYGGELAHKCAVRGYVARYQNVSYVFSLLCSHLE